MACCVDTMGKNFHILSHFIYTSIPRKRSHYSNCANEKADVQKGDFQVTQLLNDRVKI